MRYFEITGLQNGLPIESFYIECDGIPYDILQVYGDASRDYTEITKETYEQESKKQLNRHIIDFLDEMLKNGEINTDQYLIFSNEMLEELS